mgnify:CR=1 FL=1
MAHFIYSAFCDESGESTIGGQIAACKKNGITHMELRGFGKSLNINNLSVEQAKEMKEEIDREGMKVASIGSGYGKINIKEDFAPHFEAFKNTVEVAKILEAKYGFVKDNLDAKNETTLTYLNDLAKAKYKDSVDILAENVCISGELCSDGIDAFREVRIKKVVERLHISGGNVDGCHHHGVEGERSLFSVVLNKSNAVLIERGSILYTVYEDSDGSEKIVAGSINECLSVYLTVLAGLKGELYGCLINADNEVVDDLEELLVAVELDSGDVTGRSGLGFLSLATA